MNKIITLCLLIAFCLWPAGPAQSAGRDDRLPPGLEVGEITGPGREQLIRSLKKLTRSGRAAGRLSGRVELVSQAAAERETVALETPEGQPRQAYQPDPFTRRVWKVEERDNVTTLNSYDLERWTGDLVFDWQVASSEGGVTDQGRLTINLDRTRGGYLATQGLTPSLSSSSSSVTKFEDRLAEEIVRRLTLELGRSPSASELESASDDWSRKARRLASAGDWEGARSLWQELLGLNPNYGPALYNLGHYYEHQKYPEEAWRYYRSAFVSEASLLHRQALTRLTESLAKADRLPQRHAR